MRWDKFLPCSSRGSAAIISLDLLPLPSSLPVFFTLEIQTLPRACHPFPPPPEHPSAPFAAPFPITPNCQVQYLPLAAPMYSEQGIIISLQVSPHFPALTAQLQSLEELLPLSATALKDLKFIFSLPVFLQTTFQVAGEAIPLPVSPVPFSMPEPVSSSTSHLILAFSEHFYTSLFSALEESGALNVSLLVSGAREEGRSGRYTLGGTALPWECLGGTTSPT